MEPRWLRFLPEPPLQHAIEAEVLELKAGAEFAVRVPGLPRRIGRVLLAPAVLSLDSGRIERGVWRACDLAALALAECVSTEAVQDLFEHGDRDERLMAVRVLPLISSAEATRVLLQRLQSTNDQALFEAAFVDSDHAARLLDEGDWNRASLKLAFIGVAVERIMGTKERMNEALGQMLRDLAAERRAAGREVWAGTDVLLSLLPR
jgi:hypothetical protein